jgi:allophanate hydrolase subunit 2
MVVTALSGSALYQDAGRRHLDGGVPRSGAFDALAHAAATRLVGGSPQEASLEVVGLLEARVGQRLVVAVTGAATVHLDGRSAPAWTAIEVPVGTLLQVTAQGRGYLAVAGGFRPRPVLGSRSTCLMGPIGPAPVAVGDRLPVSRGGSGGTVGDVVQAPPAGSRLRAVPGPHLRLDVSRATVVDASRIGVRVRPERPVASQGTLPSLGVLPGTIQALPSGDWVVLGPDAGTMGGYPVLGVVASADLRLLAHVRPGDGLRLVPIGTEEIPDIPDPRVLRLGGLSSG